MWIMQEDKQKINSIIICKSFPHVLHNNNNNNNAINPANKIDIIQ